MTRHGTDDDNNNNDVQNELSVEIEWAFYIVSRYCLVYVLLRNRYLPATYIIASDPFHVTRIYIIIIIIFI